MKPRVPRHSAAGPSPFSRDLERRRAAALATRSAATSSPETLGDATGAPESFSTIGVRYAVGEGVDRIVSDRAAHNLSGVKEWRIFGPACVDALLGHCVGRRMKDELLLATLPASTVLANDEFRPSDEIAVAVRTARRWGDRLRRVDPSTTATAATRRRGCSVCCGRSG